MIKAGRTRWTGHTASVGRKIHAGFWWGNLKERDYLEDLDVDGKIILKRMLEK
jgi:hypothetical protein